MLDESDWACYHGEKQSAITPKEQVKELDEEKLDL